MSNSGRFGTRGSNLSISTLSDNSSINATVLTLNRKQSLIPNVFYCKLFQIGP